MAIPNKAKLLVKKKMEMSKADAKFKLNLASEKIYFNPPTKMQLIKIAAITALSLIMKNSLAGGHNKQENKDFLKKDIISKTILKTSSNDIDKSILSDLLLKCHDSLLDELPSVDDKLNAEEIIANIEKANDIDKKKNSSKTQSLQNSIKDAINKAEKIAKYAAIGIGATQIINKSVKNFKSKEEDVIAQKNQIKKNITSYKHIIEHTIYQTEDITNKSDFPSPNKQRYIQRLLRNLYGLMKAEYESIKNSDDESSKSFKKTFEDLLNAVKKIDSIILALALVTTIYINNKLKMNKMSKNSLTELASDMTCITEITEPPDIPLSSSKFEIKLKCSVNNDEDIVPHEPIQEKLKKFSCSEDVPEKDLNDAVVKEELATIAIIKNTKKDDMHILVSNGAHVNQETKICVINNLDVYSPVNGTINNISNNEIIINNILEYEDKLSDKIESLNSKYQDLIDLKTFLKTYYVKSLYPIMLSEAIKDTSIYNIYNGIENKYKLIIDEFNVVNTKYENSIKQISGKDNVEFHSKNETLDSIKIEIDLAEKNFYLSLKNIGKNSIDVARATSAIDSEYILFEYYAFTLGAKLNSLINPNKFESKFKFLINQYIDKRFVLDKYSKNKLSTQIGILIEKMSGIVFPMGISNSDKYWATAITKYNYNKSTTQLKDWLYSLANKNKKLINKDEEVNKILVLFNLYLNADTIYKNNKAILNSTSLKKETIIEGDSINALMLDLWINYDNIQNEIKKLENSIESLSTFQTYSLVQYKGQQARLYMLSDDIACESKEKDQYINPKSKIGYNDIRYWQKWCAGATLASCVNPATGWSTGWIINSIIKFPVVYIPTKVISTKYGFIVIGITICGIYIFPWIMYVNLSLGFSTPFGDPTSMLKAEIQSLKESISLQLLDTKMSVIKKMLKESKDDIDTKRSDITMLKKELKDLKQNKPIKGKFKTQNKTSINNKGKIDKNQQKAQKDFDKKTSDVKTSQDKANEKRRKLEENMSYEKAKKEYTQKTSDLTKLIISESLVLYKMEIKYALLKDVYDTGTSMAGISIALDNLEKNIKKQLDKLEKLVDNMNKILAALPYILCPDTCNFGPTIKNPKPIIPISEDLDDNINNAILDPIINKFKLSNSKMLNSITNKVGVHQLQDFKKALSSAMMVIIKKNAFPKYETLDITNIAWVSFLYLEFVVKGAQTYGFPGQMPLPLS